MSAVELVDVAAGYGGDPILRGIDVKVEQGELLAVLGASGSGKTTLLRVLAGFVRPVSGVVRLGDVPVSGEGDWVPTERRRLGLVPQEGALFPHLDVAGNVGFGLPRGSDARIAELLDLVGLSGLQASRPQELSGGQQQRVALARALAPCPEVLLLDEPFSALDAGLRTHLRSEVRELLARLGTTAILVTHDQDEALEMADRVAIMLDGRIEQVAAPDDLYETPGSLYVAGFVGEGTALSGRRTGSGDITCALGRMRATTTGVDGESGTVFVRPEDLVLVAGDGIPGTVAQRVVRGGDVLLTVRLDAEPGLDVLVRVPRSQSPRPGEPVRLVATGRARFFP